MYSVNYKEMKKAAGVKAFVCANITTALMNPSDIDKIKAGDEAVAKQVGEDISCTIQHKGIFEGQYVMDLDGKLLAVDENLMEQGFETGESFFIDEEVLETLLVTKAPTFSDVYNYGGMKRLTGYAPIFENHDETKEVIAISTITESINVIQQEIERINSQFGQITKISTMNATETNQVVGQSEEQTAATHEMTKLIIDLVEMSHTLQEHTNTCKI